MKTKFKKKLRIQIPSVLFWKVKIKKSPQFIFRNFLFNWFKIICEKILIIQLKLILNFYFNNNTQKNFLTIL